ncbi:hypothetical protein J2X98_001973 [Pseudarthrobacter enclensis]|uniref:Uncharacterized protein n=1 Tax=Pseudarthrobacter enclensis TaxID=993070 RepID=A0ABT9RUC7_9MICC|nr:hypothetical protein [Pseudarthrobacter enclensis]
MLLPTGNQPIFTRTTLRASRDNPVDTRLWPGAGGPAACTRPQMCVWFYAAGT